MYVQKEHAAADGIDKDYCVAMLVQIKKGVEPYVVDNVCVPVSKDLGKDYNISIPYAYLNQSNDVSHTTLKQCE